VALAFYPEPPGVLDVLFGERRPALPAELRTLLRTVSPRPEQALELPAELRSLARPF
jgi:hypothetical protein